MKAMILAAGLGTRLLPYSLVRPKPLFPVCNRPLLLHTIDRLREAGFHEPIGCLGYHHHHTIAALHRTAQHVPGLDHVAKLRALDGERPIPPRAVREHHGVEAPVPHESLEVHVSSDSSQARDILLALEHVKNVEDDGDALMVEIAPEMEDTSVILHSLVAGGAKVTGVKEIEMDLEDAFMTVTKGKVQ